MAVILLVPKTKMADVDKLISLRNLLVRKVMWVLTTTSTSLILSCMTRIAYIYSCLPSTHSLIFFTYRDSTLSLILLHCDFQRQYTLSLLHFDFQQSTPRKCMHSAIHFFLVLPFRLNVFQPQTQLQKFSSNPKRDKQPTWEKTCSS